MLRAVPLLITAVAVTACALDGTAPEFSLDGLPDGLDVRLTVEPQEVRQHDAFSVELSVTNTTPDTIRVVTAHSCLAIPHVIRNGQRLPFMGSNWGCYSAITTHTIAPDETELRTWSMRAELYAQFPGEVDGTPVPTGTYLVQAEFDTYSEASPSRKPFIERMLRVE